MQIPLWSTTSAKHFTYARTGSKPIDIHPVIRMTTQTTYMMVEWKFINQKSSGYYYCSIRLCEDGEDIKLTLG